MKLVQLVDDAHRWWRWGSTYVFAAIVAFPGIWLASPELQALLPPKLVSMVAPFVGVLGFAIRITQRAGKDAPKFGGQFDRGDHHAE